MNKFSSTLSASNVDIKKARAEALASTTVLEVETFIQNLKRDKNELSCRLTDLTDLAPDNTYSLRPGAKNFDAGAWMKELHKTKMDIELKTIELDVAEAIYKEWFGETTTEATESVEV